ncbi:MAG: helix-turn-helix domain-containing protein [Nitrosopumilus sp.]|nr:helix-turn-helix domain-containing protein [Nitrosopumilus sp.]
MGWASQWLKRYREEGIEGLKDRPKGGRHPKISGQIEYRIRTILKESNQGWSTKQVEELIISCYLMRGHFRIHFRIVTSLF